MRIAKDKEFQFLLEDMAEYRKLQKDETLSLNEVVRRKEIETREARVKARQKITGEGSAAAGSASANGKKVAAKSRKPGNGSATRPDDGLLAEERNLEAELAAEKEQKNAKDVLLAEAVKVMADEVDLQKHGANPKLAERAASAPGKAPAKMWLQ